MDYEKMSKDELIELAKKNEAMIYEGFQYKNMYEKLITKIEQIGKLFLALFISIILLILFIIIVGGLL